MTNEWILEVETHVPIPIIVSDGTGILKGTLLKAADPWTGSASDGNNDILGGVTKIEKIVSNGETTIGVYRGGIFKVVACGIIAMGDALVTKGSANLVIAATANQKNVIGIALEAATEAETFLMELRPTTMNVS